MLIKYSVPVIKQYKASYHLRHSTSTTLAFSGQKIALEASELKAQAVPTTNLVQVKSAAAHFIATRLRFNHQERSTMDVTLNRTYVLAATENHARLAFATNYSLVVGGALQHSVRDDTLGQFDTPFRFTFRGTPLTTTIGVNCFLRCPWRYGVPLLIWYCSWYHFRLFETHVQVEHLLQRKSQHRPRGRQHGRTIVA